MLFTLRPLVLESEGLAAALNTMAEKMNETYNQNVIVETDENVIYDLEMNSQTVIFTIAEEAVNNVGKGTKIEVVIPLTDDAADRIRKFQ
ncbi:MAG: hypothetical protein B5M51_09745 [Anaerolinea sp. 4484_236]|nr:MAG: hypothetical protein B5M51_09745 [Anaerolinea sp. 4484_236]